MKTQLSLIGVSALSRGMSQFVILLAPCSMLLVLSLELASSSTISSSKITLQREIQYHEAKQIKQLFCNKLLSEFHISLTFWEVVHLASNLEICGSSKLSQRYLGCQLCSFARAAIRKQYRLGQHKQLKFASLQFWRLKSKNKQCWLGQCPQKPLSLSCK